MASDVLSLFGMDPNVIQQNRVQSGIDTAARMNPHYAIGAAGGQAFGAGLNSAFGLQTPDMQQASRVKSALQGVNLETPEGLRQAAQQLSVNGDYARAMALVAEARAMEEEARSAAQVNVTGFKTYVLGDGTEVQGALVNDVPSIRQGGQWVPMPEDAQPKLTDPSAKATTGLTLENARVELEQTPNFSGLSSSDQIRAHYWVANEAKRLVSTGEYDINSAMRVAAQKLNSYIDEGFLSSIFNTSDLNIPEVGSPAGVEETESVSSGKGKYGTVIGTQTGGYEFMGGDDRKRENWKKLDE